MPHPAAAPPSLVDAATLSGDELRHKLRTRAPFARRYQLKRELSRGRMSNLSLYRDHLIGRTVALKSLSPKRAGDREAELRFLREATIQGQLEHPAIIPVYDVGVDPGGTIYFTMKRIRGINLDEILDGLSWGREGFAELYTRRRLLQALANVCLAVDFAHHRGIIHRDLKPSNIMLGDFGEVYVLDWGLARFDADRPEEDAASGGGPGSGESEASGYRPAAAFALQTLPGALLGTPGYMAPEQLGAAEEVGPTADVYALGAILFELLTGAPLHDPENPADAVRSTIQGPAPRPSARAPEHPIPPELDALCHRAIRRDPPRRLANARLLHDALERYLAGEHDTELRQEVAAEHIQAAQEHQRSTADPVAGRRRAIRELGRAVALHPGNHAATNALVALLGEMPSETPPAVEEATTRARYRYWRVVARFSGFAYLSTILGAPLIGWTGSTEPALAVLFYLLIVLAAATSFWISRQETPSIALTLAVCITSNLAFATLSGLAGPLLITPMILTLNTGAFALLLGRRLRWWILSAGVAAILIPLGLELSGVLEPSYAFVDGAMTVRSRMISAEPLPSLVFLTVASVTTLVTATLLFSELRELVLRSERRFYLYTWQLRQLLPGKLR